MNPKDNTINDSNFVKLLHNDNYYRHIFKKTEKIISVVFYILNNINIEKRSETLTSNIASKAHFAHENALRTLEVKPISSKEVLEQFAQSLVGLDSTLRIAAASGVLSPDVLAVMVTEIDSVLRGLKTYINPDNKDELVFSPAGYETSFPGDAYTSRPRTVHRKSQQNMVTAVASPVATSDDRRQRIKTILEAKGQATIKDISEIVTDVSEKTIQRELNAMIEENVVKRQGERRWSKYSVF